MRASHTSLRWLTASDVSHVVRFGRPAAPRRPWVCRSVGRVLVALPHTGCRRRDGPGQSPQRPGITGVSAESVDAFVALYRERLERFDVLLGERGDPAFRRRLIDGIKTSALAGIAADTLPAAEARELDYLLEFELSGLIGILRRFSRSQPQGRPEEIVAVVYRIMGREPARRAKVLQLLAASESLPRED